MVVCRKPSIQPVTQLKLELICFLTTLTNTHLSFPGCLSLSSYLYNYPAFWTMNFTQDNFQTLKNHSNTLAFKPYTTTFIQLYESNYNFNYTYISWELLVTAEAPAGYNDIVGIFTHFLCRHLNLRVMSGLLLWTIMHKEFLQQI